MWKYVFAVTLFVLLWTLVWIVGAPVWTGAFGTVCIGVGVGAWLTVRAAQTAQAAQALAQSLSVSAPYTTTGLPHALETWHKELPPGTRARALASLPWYWLLGPQEAGKSALLRGSGWQLSAATRDAPVNGAGPLEHMRFWLSREAVAVESSGASAHALIDSLRHNRGLRPMQGILLVVPAMLLAEETAATVRHLAHKLRHDLDQATSRMGAAPPVYVVVSQCDKIEGFEEMVAGLSIRQRDGIWGGVVDWPAPPLSVKDAITARWDELAKRLRRMSLEHLADDHSQAERDRIYRFPEGFAALRANFTVLIGALGAPDSCRHAPPLRGIFCTAVVGAQAQPVGVLVGDLFRRILAADRALCPQRQGRIARPYQGMRRWRLATAVAALTIIALPIGAYHGNRAMVSATRDLVQEVASERAANRNKLVPPASLDRLRLGLYDLNRYALNAPLLARLAGMYQGDTLQDGLRTFYMKMLQDELISPIVLHDIQQMHNFAQRYAHTRVPPAGPEYKVYFDKLKTHLLLTNAGAQNDAPMGEAERSWLIETLVNRWARALSNDPDPAVQAQMGQHVAYYLEYIKDRAEHCPSRDNGAVGMTRAILARLSPLDARLEALIGDAESYSLGLPQLLNDIAAPLHSEQTVRGGFTRRGYENVVRARLEGTSQEPDAWVLGRSSTPQAQPSRAQLTAYYWSRYADAWRSFLSSLQVDVPRNPKAALAMVQELTRADPPPYPRIVAAVASNTRLIPAQSGDKALADFLHFVNAGASGDVAQGPLDAYQDQLMALRGALETYLDDPRDKEALLNQLQQTSHRVHGLLRASERSGGEDLLRGLLWAPIELITQSVAPDDAASG